MLGSAAIIVVFAIAKTDWHDAMFAAPLFAALAARVRRIAMIAASYFRLGVDSH